MTEQEFNELLENIKNNKFIGNELTITTRNFEEDVIEGSLDFNDEKAIILAETLKNNPCITKLNLYHNDIGVIGATALASIVSLEFLDLGSNNIYYSENQHEHFFNMINAFTDNKTIISLHLSDCYIPDEMIAQLIKDNTTIKHLTLSRHLTDKALEFIGENKTLEWLSVSSNEITDKGVEYILKNTSLKELDIIQAQITDVGIELLKTHPTLKTLYIGNSEIIINDNTSDLFLENGNGYLEKQDSHYTNLTGNLHENGEQ